MQLVVASGLRSQAMARTRLEGIQRTGAAEAQPKMLGPLQRKELPNLTNRPSHRLQPWALSSANLNLARAASNMRHLPR